LRWREVDAVEAVEVSLSILFLVVELNSASLVLGSTLKLFKGATSFLGFATVICLGILEQ
jgi:hypothetical protein